MSPSQKGLNRARKLTEEQEERTAVATWRSGTEVGACNACGWLGSVLVIYAKTLQVRFCAKCINSINKYAGAVD